MCMIGVEYLRVVSERFQNMKRIAEEAMKQVSDSGLFWSENEDAESIAVIVNRMSNEMVPRWSNCFITRGKEPYNSDNEITQYFLSRQDLIRCWERGWSKFYEALHQVKADDLLEKVMIEDQPHTVLETIEKVLFQKTYYIGQIIYISKYLQSDDWKNIKII